MDAKTLLEQFLGQAGGGSGGSLHPSKQGGWPAQDAPAKPGSPWQTPHPGKFPAKIPQKGQGPTAWPAQWPSAPPQTQQPPPGQGGLMDRARDLLGGVGTGGAAAGGLAADGLLGALFGRKGAARSVLTHGGAAALGALAFRAWQNWQAGQQPATAPPASRPDAAAETAFIPGATPAAAGEPFELSLIRAMVGAAQADGHIDATERAKIFEQVERASLDAESKGFVFTLLNARIGVEEVAAAANSPEQAAELWLASRLAMDPDHPAERVYLDALAHRMGIPPELVAHLERQVQVAAAAVQQA
jgi:uncharacterized membrane protein YebE (DUF533 family)